MVYSEKTFLLADISLEIVLGMFFFIFSKADILFVEKKLILRFYSTIKAISTIKRVEMINKKKFAKTVLDGNFETFVIYVTSLNYSLNKQIKLNKHAIKLKNSK